MSFIKTRIFSFVALSAMAGSCGYLGREVYYVTTDSFVAPAILSPDNDLVLDSKLKLSSLLLEKGKAESTLEEANAELEAGDKAILELNKLKIMASKALGWTKSTTKQQVTAGGADIETLASQRDALVKMFGRQAVIVNEANNQLQAGMILKQDYTKEVQVLDQIQIEIFENDRSRMQTDLLLKQASMGQNSLYSKGSMPMPEMVMSADQLVRIECQLLEIEATMRAKASEKIKLEEELAKIQKLEVELRGRPIFKAIENNVDIAFAPYSSLKDIQPGSHLMDCVWGVFSCRDVGTITNIIPGETILPDIFGSGQVRGQFVTLSVSTIHHDESMQSKVLRVRTDTHQINVKNIITIHN